MKHSTGKPTKAEAARMARLKNMPCVACTKYRIGTLNECDVHHLLSGNKRRGHMFTIPLCRWHHTGQEYSDYSATRRELELNRGPSLALSSKRFHATFGTDDELLAFTNQLLESRYACRD